MRLAALLVRMVRYRVAAMIWLFFLLGGAGAGILERPGRTFALALAALACLYASATSVNDLADEDVDRINHPGDPGRPLVVGGASRRDLWLVHALAGAGALLLTAPIGGAAVALAAASLVVSWAYSLPPLRLSYRTWLCPLALALAYVAIPYGLGLAVAGERPRGHDLVLGGALGCLFLARIVLKDFRDREGDAAYAKPTALLRFGEGAVCAASAAALLAGDALLLVALHAPLALALLVQAHVLAIAAMLVRLRRARDGRTEQLAIGTGAKVGNGLLLCVLAWIALEAHGTPAADRTVVVAALAALVGAAFAALVADPERAAIAYKG